MNQHSRMVESKPFRREEPLELPPGNLFSRMLTARAIAAVKGVNVNHVAEVLWPNDRNLSAIVKAATNPAMTTVPTWAQELAVKHVADTVEALGAYSAAMEIFQNSLLLTWNRYGQISVPGFVASSVNGSFVQEDQPIPVRQLSDGAQSLFPYKVASIAVLTDEMIESSNAEAMITDTLVKSAALAIDKAFFDANASTAARPAGVRYNVAASTPSTNTDPFGAFYEDISTVMQGVGLVGGKGPYYLASSIGRTASMRSRWLEEADYIRTIMSPSIGNDMVAIAPQAVAVAIDPAPVVETSNTGTLVMDDTSPGLPDTSQPTRGLFQTRSTAVKVRWPVSWVLRDPRGVCWLTPAWK